MGCALVLNTQVVFELKLFDLCLFCKTDISTKGSTSSSLDTSDERKKNSPVSLVKLSRSGLLLFSFHDNKFHENVVDILADIFLSLRSGKLKSPRWVLYDHLAFTYEEYLLSYIESNNKFACQQVVPSCISNSGNMHIV